MDYSPYEDIRPLLSHEVPEAIRELLANAELKALYNQLGVSPSWDELTTLLSPVSTVADFKTNFSAQLVRHVMKRTCQSVAPLQGTANISGNEGYTYISNHRDIILDSAFLNVLLYDAGAKHPETALGDNILVAPWVERLVKLNGSFIVRRNLQGREVLLAAKQLSSYMHDAVASGTSVWIAQREGRAKDSNDRTQPALLKMLGLSGGERGIIANLRKLHIIPLSCSYEFDPCDYLKAREMQLKRDMPTYVKTKAEDALNMQTGVMGFKGRVSFALGTPLNQLLDQYPELDALAEPERPAAIAAILDREIHRNYTLYPCNYIAWDTLTGQATHQDRYSDADRKHFDDYITQQLCRMEMPEGYRADQDFLRHCLLTMYANPAINHAAAQAN